MGFKYIPGMEKALPDYTERLKRRTGATEDVLKGKHKAGKLTEAEALANAIGKNS